MYLIVIALIFGLVYFSFNTIKIIISDLYMVTEDKFIYFRRWFIILLITNVFLLISILFYYLYFIPIILKGNSGPVGNVGDKGLPGDDTVTCDSNLECL